MATSNAELAALAGFTVAFFRSSDELWDVFQKARRGGWTGERLLAAARNTRWFRRHNEAERRAQLLKTSDPAEYKARRNAARAEVEQVAASLNVRITDQRRNNLANLVFVDGWTSAQVESYLKDTNQYERRSAAQLEVDYLKKEQPGEYQRRVTDRYYHVRNIARESGLGRDRDIIEEVAQRALRNDWSDERILNALSVRDKTVLRDTRRMGPQTHGRVAQGEHLARQMGQEYGIRVRDTMVAKMARNFATGRTDENGIKDWFEDRAKRHYPALRDDLRAGLTVRDVAEPYFEAMSRILEVNPQNLNLWEPKIRRALTGRDQEGKPTTQSIYDFEVDLRQDPRWMGTDNAIESVFGNGYKALQDMGVMS